MLLLKRRQPSAQSFIEVACGCLVLVPIALLTVDVACVLGVNHANNHLAQAAARVAANKPSRDTAYNAAMQATSLVDKPNVVSDVQVTDFRYDEMQRLVSVQTQMELGLPIPLPGASSVKLNAISTQPIVAIPAAR